MFSMKQILVPVAFSEPCAGSVRYARYLAGRFHAALTLLHVVPPPYSGYGPPEAFVRSTLRQAAADMLSQAQSGMAAFLREELTGLDVSRMVLEGRPAEEIVETAHNENFDLILMATHGHGPARQLLLGSVTAKVLHDADCPVWTGTHLEPASPAGDIRLRHILCAVNLGPHSIPVLNYAAGLAAGFDARLSLLYVVPLDNATEEYYFSPEWRGQLLRAAREDLDKLQQAVGSKAGIYVEMGEVRRTVCAEAGNLRADLLVIGRSAHYGMGGRLPTHTYAIVRDAPCPVVSV